MSVRILVTVGTVADCTQASSLIEGLDAQYLLADNGYDTDALVAEAEARQMTAVIPPKKNRTRPRACDRALYCLRHWIETRFCI